MKDAHLTDDALVTLCVDEASTESHAHVVGCPACEQRLRATAALLDEIAGAAAQSADAAFPPERRARQQMRILQRIEQHARVARVLAFPTTHAAAPALHARPTRVRRWVAAAAAAGLFVGMLAGHLVHQLPVLRRPAAVQTVPPAGQPASVLRASTAPVSDDEFLRGILQAVARPSPVALERIDAVTPVAWEIQ